MEQKSMKLPPRKKTAEEKMYPSMARGDEPEYPYGLRVNLDEEQLKQLGIDKLPAVDDETAIEATGHVCSSNTSKDQDGTRRSLSIQITHLALK